MAGFRLSGFNKISRQVAAKFARGNIYNLRLGIWCKRCSIRFMS